MIFRQKVDLGRFKKSMEGITTFASLIEQADPAHRQKIIDQAREQDTDFLNRVLRKVVYFEELIYLDETILAEILSRTSAKVLAHALQGTPPDFRAKFIKQVGHREAKLVREEEEKMPAGKMSHSLVLGAQRAILKNGRVLESQSKFVFELNDCPRFTAKKPQKVAKV